MNRFLNHLFDFDAPATRGETLYHRAVEIFFAYWVIYFAWSWGFYITMITDVVLLGLAAGVVVLTFRYFYGLRQRLAAEAGR